MNNINRAIVIFPEFENVFHIEQLRSKFDPLSTTIGPHITLVFPFESDLSIEQLKAHIQQVVQGFKPFSIHLHGISGSENEYLFLNVIKGKEEIIELHDRLYRGLLAEYLHQEIHFVPHLTVGRIKEGTLFQNALISVQNMKESFQTTVNKITVYRIGVKKPIESILSF